MLKFKVDRGLGQAPLPEEQKYRDYKAQYASTLAIIDKEPYKGSLCVFPTVTLKKPPFWAFVPTIATKQKQLIWDIVRDVDYSDLRHVNAIQPGFYQINLEPKQSPLYKFHLKSGRQWRKGMNPAMVSLFSCHKGDSSSPKHRPKGWRSFGLDILNGANGRGMSPTLLTKQAMLFVAGYNSKRLVLGGLPLSRKQLVNKVTGKLACIIDRYVGFNGERLFDYNGYLIGKILLANNEIEVRASKEWMPLLNKAFSDNYGKIVYHEHTYDWAHALQPRKIVDEPTPEPRPAPEESLADRTHHAGVTGLRQPANEFFNRPLAEIPDQATLNTLLAAQRNELTEEEEEQEEWYDEEGADTDEELP